MQHLALGVQSSYRTTYGPPEVLSVREVPLPEPGPGETLVRVHAATVSRTDCGVLEGRPFVLRLMVGWPRPRIAATGTDFAGEVVAVGPGAPRFAVGERVMGFDDLGVGSHAEYLLLRAKQGAVQVPVDVSYEDAAASMEGAHYARNFINKVPLKRGDKVLVYGASGAIGSAAVALLRDAGAVVTAVCPGRHHGVVAGLGPDHLLDSDDPQWLGGLQDRSFDYFFDAVGKLTFAAVRRLLPADGVYASSELGPWSQNLLFAAAAPFMRGPKVRFPVPTGLSKSLELVSRLLADGAYSPLIDRHYVLADLREAFEYVASGRKVGNVILRPGADQT